MSHGGVLKALARGGPLCGRHVIVTAHPDDETVSAAALLSRAAWAVTIVQLTDGSQSTDPSRPIVAERRRRERTEALRLAKWEGATLIDAGCPGREAYQHVPELVRIVQAASAGATAVWTHPYEGGHLDHDTAALVVSLALAPMLASVRPAALEFASYFMASSGRSVFGDFWPDDLCPTAPVKLSAVELGRKRAAMGAYESQAGILRKFRTPGLERYRVAPVYDFAAAVPPPLCRWDVKGYAPPTATWREAVLPGRRMSA